MVNGSEVLPIPPAPPAKQLVITLNQDGSLSVTGPLENKMMCYAMLMIAHDSLKDFYDARAANSAGIVVPPAGLRV